MSPDGRFVLFHQADVIGAREMVDRGTLDDIGLAALEHASPSSTERGASEPSSPARITALISTPFPERNATLSPDGRWLAYDANESGGPEIYVRPFPA